MGTFTRNDELPGAPDADGREMTTVEFLRRAMQLLLDFADSLADSAPAGLTLSTSPAAPAASSARTVEAVQRAVAAALLAIADPHSETSTPMGVLEHALDAIRGTLEQEDRPGEKRSWLLVSLVTATVRGLIADGLVTDPRGFRAINDEDFGQWILRHGAHPDVLDYALIRGLYDLVFGYEDGDPDRPAFGAGLAVFLTGLVLFAHKGAIFWKMTAGMGDVVFAPIYQALRRRGVDFEFFHRVDALHLDSRRLAIDGITMGRQVRLADHVDRYEPLTAVRGLPVFPSLPLFAQIEAKEGVASLESHLEDRRDDVETRVLRRGEDFDHVVLAVSLSMVELVAAELIEDSPEWRAMTTHIRTVATQAFQIWLGPDEPSLGWSRPGVTTSAYIPPFETWASMPQTLWAEDWPAHDRPGTVAYFCGSLAAEWPTTAPHVDYVRDCRGRVRAEAVTFLDEHLRLFLPGAVDGKGFDWELLSGNDGRVDGAALASQHVSTNIDPSDRYVQSLPGTDRYRLRSDESGYDNLVLAGDWTDSGLNAGCIEAAVLSGLQAANALLGRGRHHRIRGFYLP